MKVITTVGTSLFDNYQKTTGNNFRYYNFFKDKEYYCELYKGKESSQQEKLLKKNECIRNDGKFQEWISNNNDTCCAEISSLRKILNEPSLKKEKIAEVRLLATQTILSRLAAEIIRDKFSKVIKGVEIKFDPDVGDVIDGLSLVSADDFEKKGLSVLVDRLDKLGIYNKKIVLNITAGYKGVIPFLTILGQLNEDAEIMYLYEDSGKIINIPKISIAFDWSVMEEACFYLRGEYLSSEERSDDVVQFLRERSLVENDGEGIKQTSVGRFVQKIINGKAPYGSVLGDIVELKLLEYYSNNPDKYFPKVMRGVKKLKINNAEYSVKVSGRDLGDLDVVLIDETAAKFICIEAKPFARLDEVIGAFLGDDEYEGRQRSLQNRLDFFVFHSIWPEKFILLVHRLNVSDINLFKEKLQKCKSKFEGMVRDNNAKTVFEVMTASIPFAKSNPYSSFINSDLLLETIDLD